MLKIDLWPEATKFIDALELKYQWQMVEKIYRLAQNPAPPRSKQLAGFEPLRRFRSGKFRIVYFVKGGTLGVPLVDRRNDDKVYHRVAQKFRRN